MASYAEIGSTHDLCHRSKLNFDPTTDVPALTDKVILVTGGTAGLGRETILSFAAHGPAHIYFTGRSQSSADGLLAEVQKQSPKTPVHFIRCDLTSLDDVKRAMQELLQQIDRLDIFMANAGIMATPPGVTKDGYEVQFGTNHVGHALMANLLTPLLEETARKTGDARIIWNTSQGAALHPSEGIAFDTLKSDQANLSRFAANWVRYGQSKVANLLYAAEYARRHPSIVSVPIHPGVSATGLVTSLDFWSRMLVYVTTPFSRLAPDQCAWNQQWAATAVVGKGPGQVQSGVYYEPVGVHVEPKGKGNDLELAKRLWEWTEKELQAY